MTNFRKDYKQHGLHRVAEPEGALPQAADRLDPDGPLFSNEIEIDVFRLNIDSASFNQIEGSVAEDSTTIGERIEDIVRRRGKMENPVTGSGGMLQGRVSRVGPDYSGPLQVGDRIATLVSLTLTPLSIHKIKSINVSSDQVDVEATAYLWDSAPVAKLPDDIPERVALSLFDVCGICRHAERLAREVDDMAILGLGKSGMLAAFAARQVLGDSGSILAIDLNEGVMPKLKKGGIIDDFRRADATRPVDVYDQILDMTGGEPVGGALNTCNVENTEMSAILGVEERGKVFFFNMATRFSKVTLGAEGLSKDIDVMMGNGYARGHSDLAVELFREHELLRQLWPVE